MKVIYFGKIADVTKKTVEEIELQNKNVKSLITFLNEKYDINLSEMQIAVNQNLVSKSELLELKDTDEVAILSAFAGG